MYDLDPVPEMTKEQHAAAFAFVQSQLRFQPNDPFWQNMYELLSGPFINTHRRPW